MTDPLEHGTEVPPSTAPPGAPTTRKRSVSVGQILAGILLVLVVIFIAENHDDVKIRLIAGPKITAPIWVALVIAAVVGALIAALMRFRRQRRSKG